MITDTLHALLADCHRTPDDDHALLVAADCAAENDEPRVEWVLRLLASRRYGRIATGSRAYGSVKPDSDYDWVLRTHTDTLRQRLWAWCDQDRSSGPTTEAYEGAGSYRLAGSYRYGPINLIRVDTWPQFDVWKEGTRNLLIKRSDAGTVISRGYAIAEFQRLARRDRL